MFTFTTFYQQHRSNWYKSECSDDALNIHHSQSSTHSEGALCALAAALWQSSSTQACWDATSYTGAPMAVRPHHGFHGVTPNTHGSLEVGKVAGNEWMTCTNMEGKVGDRVY